MNTNFIVLTPIITEKALTEQQTLSKYSFWVIRNATKGQIEKSFEAIFKIKPLSINTIIVKGKNKTDWKKRKPIKKSDRKKAIITIDKSKTIESLKLNTK